MPRIDVWMPVRNGGTTLDAAVRSILRQTFPDWSLILVDDGSTDSTAGRIDAWAGRDSRIRAIHRPAGGIVAALNAAAAVSDAPLVARMDADDVAHARRFERQLGIPADIVATRVRCGGGAGEGMRLYVRWQNGLTDPAAIVDSLFVESPIAHPTVLMTRDVLERAGGYRHVGWAEDYDLWLRAWRAGARFAKVPEVLLTWRDGPARLTRTHPMYSERAMREAKVHHLPHHPILQRGPLSVWGAGPVGRAWIRDLLGMGLDVEQAIDIDARKIGRKLRNRVPVRTPEEALARRRGPVIGAVGSRGARNLIRRRLVEAGLLESSDFLFVA